MSVCLIAVAVFLSCVSPISASVRSKSEFTTKESSPTTAAPMTSQSGRSTTDCALKCEPPVMTYCYAFAFVPEKKICLLSELPNADFASVAPSGLAYRKKTDKKLVQINGKIFQVIQHRSKGELSFAQGWTEYENGFGDDTDFWIGLRKMHELTGSESKLLRVEAVTWSDELNVCEYSGFTVADASTNYIMTYASYLSGSSNTSIDSLANNNGHPFSTMDRDNDHFIASCSSIFGSAGWWFRACTRSNPNALYRNSPVVDRTAMHWAGATADSEEALKSIRLMLQLV